MENRSLFYQQKNDFQPNWKGFCIYAGFFRGAFILSGAKPTMHHPSLRENLAPEFHDSSGWPHCRHWIRRLALRLRQWEQRLYMPVAKS